MAIYSYCWAILPYPQYNLLSSAQKDKWSSHFPLEVGLIKTVYIFYSPDNKRGVGRREKLKFIDNSRSDISIND